MILLCQFFLSFLVMPIIEAFMVSTLWGWFVVPITKLPPITALQGLGLSLFVGHLIYKSRNREDTPEETSYRIGSWFGAMLVFFIVGWIVHRMMA